MHLNSPHTSCTAILKLDGCEMATPTSDYPASSVAGQVETAEGDCACLTFEVLDEKQAIRSVSDNGAGATVLFSGTTRDNFQGKTT